MDRDSLVLDEITYPSCTAREKEAFFFYSFKHCCAFSSSFFSVSSNDCLPLLLLIPHNVEATTKRQAWMASASGVDPNRCDSSCSVNIRLSTLIGDNTSGGGGVRTHARKRGRK
jgi:hypothetical protein